MQNIIINKLSSVFMACAVVAGVASAVDVPPSGLINVDFATAPGGDWQKADIAGAAGDVTSVATMNTKVASPGPGAFGASPSTAYANSVNWGYAGRTLFATPASVAAAGMRVAVTNKTGASVTGLTINYTLCVPFNNTGVAESPRGFVVYYTTNVTGVGGWVNLGNHVPPADTLGSKTNITFTVSPAGGWANNAPLYVMWADDNASGNDVCYAVSNFTFTAVAAAAGGFTAYNDCVYSATADDLNNAANVTRYALNSGTYLASGPLTNQADGAATPVVVTLVANNGTPSFSTGGGTNCLAGTDAGAIFRGMAGLRGTEGLPAGVANASVDLVFTNLNPAKAYLFATTANRGCTIADGGTPALWVTNRWTKFTLFGGVTNCANASSIGANVIFHSPTNSAVSFSTGENTFNGYVARWSGIRCDASGSFRVRAENEGLNGHSNVACYGFSAFMLKEGPAVNLPPALSITNPVDWAAVAIGSSVSVLATATDDALVTSVSFYLDGVLLGSSVTSPYGTTWPNATMGVHTLKAVAWDNTGLATTSVVVNVSVVPQPGYGGLQFDGMNDSVSFGQATNLGAARFTLECWMRKKGTGLTSSSGSGGIVAVPLITKGRGEAENSNVDCNYFFGILPSGALAADFEQFYADGGQAAGQNYPITGISTAAGDGAWHHVAVTYDGSNWVLYLDGVVDRTLNIGSHTPRFDSIQHAGLGVAMNSSGTTEGAFQGLMDEARIWNYARTQAQITNSMYSEVISAPGLIGRWSLNETNGTTAANSGSTGVNGTLVNGPVWTTGYPLVPVVDPLPSATLTAPAAGTAVIVGTPVSLAATATDLNGSVTNVAFLVDGMVIANDATEPFTASWTPSVGGQVTLTAVAMDNDGLTRVSAAVPVFAYEPGKVALQFDGGNDYVTFGAATATLGASNFTLECWMKKTGAGLTAGSGSSGVTAVPLITKGVGESDGGNIDCDYFFGIQTSGALAADFEQYYAEGGGGMGQNYPITGISTTPGDGNWHHVAVTYDCSNWVLYVDGVVDRALNVGHHVPRFDSIQHAGIGVALNSTGAASGAFAGILDEVRIWNYARTPEQIAVNRTNAISAANGLLGRWSLNEGSGTVAGNSVPGSPAGTLVNGPVWCVGQTLGAPGATAPYVTLTAPPNGATFIAGANVTLTATAMDDDGNVTGVEFFRDGLSLGTASSAPYSVLWSGVTLGTHLLIAVATDNDGLITTSAVVTVTVNAPNLPPTVTSLVPANGAANVPVSATLQATVSDPEGANLAVSFYGRPAGAVTSAGADFTITVLPDTQYYSQDYPWIFTNQTAWIVANRTSRNIAYVSHLGDVTDDADSQMYQWTNAASAMYLLENPVTTGLPDGMPYGIAPGNHDHVGGTVGYNQYFGVSHFTGKPWYGGHMGSDNQNHYDLISAGGLDFIILYTDWNYASLSYPPIDSWANSVLQAYPNRRAIIVRHGLLESSGAWTDDGVNLLNTVKTNANVFLLMNGHSAGERQYTEYVNGRRVDVLCADYQNYPNGGNGYLRLYEFSPSNNVIHVKTYSTTLGVYETDANSQFDIPYTMSGTPAPFQLLGTSNNVPSGATVACAWAGLAFGSNYEWYVVASDGTNAVTGATNLFATALPPPAPVVTTSTPYVGVTMTARTDVSPRPLKINVVDIDLTAPGLRFKLTPQSGWLDTTTEPVLQYMNGQHAQLAVNSHFFTPWPMTNTDHAANLVGIAASEGHVYSPFEENPPSPQAIHTNAPGLNITADNQASIVHRGANAYAAAEAVTLWNTISGSEQIVSNGVVIAANNTWNNTLNPRTLIGLAPGNHLVIVVIDGRQTGVSEGMTIAEAAAMLVNDYGVTEALNLDGGGSSTLAMDAPTPHIVNTPSDNPPRSVGSSLAIFATLYGYTNQPPVVVITDPADGATVSTNFTITATATDDGSVTNVAFFAEGSYLGNAAIAPYSWTWGSADAGSHALTAVATDDHGVATTSAVVNVTVVMGGQVPAIRHDGGSAATTNVTAQVGIAPSANWKYLDNGSDQGTNWQALAFDDSAWAGGLAPLGYGDPWIVTTVNSPAAPNRYITTYFRRHFTAPTGPVWTNLSLGLMRDDGAVLYLNGNELMRDNMPTGPINYLTWSSTIVGGSDENTYFPFNCSASCVIAGDNVLAVELHQRDGTSSDLGFDLGLTLQGYTITDGGPAVSNVTAHTATLLGEVTADGGQTPYVTVYFGTTDGGTDTNLWQRRLDLGSLSVGKVNGTVTNLMAGTTYFFRFMASNANGQGWAAATESFMTLGETAPQVSLTSPTNGAAFVQGETVALAATATDNGTVSNVTFFVDGVLVGTDVAAPYTASWIATTLGSHTLTAVAWDDVGLSATSIVVSITVTGVPTQVAIDFTENFNSMGTGTTPPAGWLILNQASGTPNDKYLWAAANPIVQTGVTMNSVTPLTLADAPNATNNKGFNALGASGLAGDRCIATSPTGIASVGMQSPPVTNITGSAITAFNISYDIKRFTVGASGADELPGYWLFYSVNGGTTWNNVTALNPTVANMPNTVGITSIVATNIVLSAPWANGGTLLLRWIDDNGIPSSPDQINGLDNVHLTAGSVLVVLTPPTVAITSPASGSVFTPGQVVALAATATDDGAVTNVSFFVDGGLVGSDTAAPYAATWNATSVGSHALTAVAWDDVGLVATSATVNITVALPTPDGIMFGPSGTGTRTFDALPSTNEWSTGHPGGDKNSYTTAAQLDAAVAALSAGSIASPLVSKAGSPPAYDNLVVWSSDGKFIQTCPTGIGATLLKATLVNVSGANLSQVRLAYTYAVQNLQAETVPGQRVFCSLTGAAGSWTLIPELSAVTTSTSFDVIVTLPGTWLQGATLYLLWADDNGAPSPDVYFQIDNFAATPAGPAPFAVALTAPANGQAFAYGAPIAMQAATSGVTSATATSMIFRADGVVLGDDFTSPYAFAWTNATVGAHTLDAIALLDNGTAVTSAAISVTMNSPVNLLPATPVVVAPANGATGVSQSPALTVSVSDPESSALSVAFYGREAGVAASAGPDFALVVLPDTQNYSTSYPQIFRSQTDWIVANRLNRNIAYVAGVGDIVNSAGSVAEYQNATGALYRLENPTTTGLPDGIPYGTSVGNHDQPTTLYNQYFGTNHFAGKSYYGGNYGSNNDSHYDLFRTSGMDFVVLYITMGGGSDSSLMAWGNSVLQTYANRRAIVIEHSILNVTTRPTPSTFTGEGTPLFNAFKGNTNLFLMLCGHMHGEGFRHEVLPDGRVIDIVLADYQDYPNGGNGLLRMMTFSPSNNQIRVTTYSPYTASSMTGPDSQFNLDYSMAAPAAPFIALGTNTGVASGAQTSLIWPDLTTNTTYEWYAVANDGTSSATSAVSSFTTCLNLPSTVSLTSPTDGSIVSNGFPTLTWLPVAGASGYAVTLSLPDVSRTNYYYVTGTSLPLTFPLENGAYFWTVTAYNGSGYGPFGGWSSFTLARGLASGKWSFGVMSDTQWTGVPADQINNPNNVAVSIINQLNPQFINAGVQFVVQVGDLTENGNPADVDVRAAAATNLYNAGIGFFPLRGNHESSQAAARQVTNDFPQTQGLGANTHGTFNFSSPAANLRGLSYAFDYNNTRMVLLDQFTRLDGTGADANSAMVDQVPWIATTLSNRTAGTHAFVFSHKNLIGENHVDSLFGANPSANTNAQNQFIGALQNTGVRYALSGHDHVYQRSLIASPDARSSVEEIICGSDSSKFYTPGALSSFAGQKPRETSLVQDLYRITYYVGTVDGPRFTMDYYASDETFPSGNSPAVTPTLHFNKRETFGYSLNGRRFLVPQGGSYTTVTDSVAAGTAYGETYRGTTARILAGVNGSTAKDYNNRAFTREINTGWAPAFDKASDILTLWGMADLATNRTDTYVLSMSYDPAATSTAMIEAGMFGLMKRVTPSDSWVPATDLNAGGMPNFVLGSWSNSFALGTCGVDTNTATAWAVVNQACEFAVGVLPHLSAYTVRVEANGRGTVTPACTNVTFMSDLVITATALPYSFISDIRLNGLTIGGTFGMTTTNYTWQDIVANGTALVVFGDLTVTSPTPAGTTTTPLWWLDQHGLTNGVGSFAEAAMADQDHDGFANWQEFMVGMNPNGSNEVETITSMDLGGTPGDDAMQLIWPSLPGFSYTVEHSDSLDDLYGGHGVQSVAQPGIGTTNTYTVTVPTGNRHFFRLKAQTAP